MSINRDHPDFLKFIKNEQKSLKVLFNDPFIAKNLPELAERANTIYYEYYKIKDKNLKTLPFEFSTDFNIVIENEERKVVIETLVQPDFTHVSYVLSICQNCEEPLTLIRKFHFDYAIPIHNDIDRKPVYHFQFGGEQSPRLAGLNISVENLQPWLSSPRITHIPINLALLLDMVFFEFRSEITNGIVERKEWRDFIKSNEDFLLAPYYNRVKWFITNKHKYDFLIRDYCYGQ